MAVVDRAGLLGRLLDEEVEGVADELHLVERLVDRHGHGLMQLLADDDGRVSQLRLDGDARFGRGRGRVLDRRVPGVGDDDGLLDTGRLPLLLGDLDRVAAVVLLAVACAAQALGQLAHGDVEGREAVGGTGLGPDDRALRDHGDLGALGGIGLARVALVGDLDLDALDARVELLDLGGLLLDVVPQARTDLSAAADDGDVHGEPFWVLCDPAKGIGLGERPSHRAAGPGWFLTTS